MVQAAVIGEKYIKMCAISAFSGPTAGAAPIFGENRRLTPIAALGAPFSAKRPLFSAETAVSALPKLGEKMQKRRQRLKAVKQRPSALMKLSLLRRRQRRHDRCWRWSGAGTALNGAIQRFGVMAYCRLLSLSCLFSASYL